MCGLNDVRAGNLFGWPESEKSKLIIETLKCKESKAGWSFKRWKFKNLKFKLDRFESNSKQSTYNIGGQLVTGQILDVLVLGVDDFSELFTVDNLFVNVHLHFVVEIIEFLYVSTNDLGNG